jgi:hypothetical protein
MLEHIAGDAETDKEDSVQWMAYYIGKKYYASLTLACDELGTPLVQRLDEASAESMWSDANINITQQRILRQHLHFHFGKRLFISQKKILHNENTIKFLCLLESTSITRMTIGHKSQRNALIGREMLH